MSFFGYWREYILYLEEIFCKRRVNFKVRKSFVLDIGYSISCRVNEVIYFRKVFNIGSGDRKKILYGVYGKVYWYNCVFFEKYFLVC